jgi:rubrerythrin
MCGNKCICTTSHEDARLIAAAPDMLAMLEESEWSGAYHENPDYCPICVAAKDGFHGHDADCKLGNLLKRIKGAEQCSP